MTAPEPPDVRPETRITPEDPRDPLLVTRPYPEENQRHASRHGNASRRVMGPAVASFVAVAVVAVVAIGVVALASSGNPWTGPHQSPVAVALLNVRIVDGAVPIVVYTLAALAVAFLVARRPKRKQLIASAVWVLGGGLVAVLVLWFVAATDAFGVQLQPATEAWVIASFAAIGLALSALAGSGWRRRVGAVASIPLILLAGVIGVNADFGLDTTVGSLAGISTLKTLVFPVATPLPTATLRAGGALWANWQPPSTMPTRGRTGQVVIPPTLSGFKARPAGLYLPPAALVSNPPALPLVVMMMGQPGNPDPSATQAILDRFAARHHGLAPIVVVADQLGSPGVDPLCLNTARYGNVETYIESDVVTWARTHLHVLQDAAHTTVAGYSNGGECALHFGAKFPAVWGNVLDISGEKYPGATNPARTLATVFGGSTSAYQASWPLVTLAHGSYPDTTGIFTVGSNDVAYRKVAIEVVAAAKAAKWATTLFEVPNGGHLLSALKGGLQEGYKVLFPRLGLTGPGETP